MANCTVTTTYVSYNTYELKLTETEKSLVVGAIDTVAKGDYGLTEQERKTLRGINKALIFNDKRQQQEEQ